jgi:cyanophycinase-like exopeptidase
MPRPTTLIAGQHGSSHFGTQPFLAEALRLTGKERPLALYVGAASGDDRSFGSALSTLIERAGAAQVLWPKLARRRKQYAAVRDALRCVDFVFVGGGDVDAGMRTLRDGELLGDFHAAAKRGVVFTGMSAGSIMLGQRWIRWPGAHAADAEAETYACLGITPCSVDTHGEADGWQEAKSFAAVRARELGAPARVYAVPSGGALIVGHDGAVQARGEPVPVFAASPKQRVEIETTLAATP